MINKNDLVEKLRTVLKGLVPRPLRDFLRRRPLVSLQLFFWRLHVKVLVLEAVESGQLNSLLIIAADTYSLMGSRGDDAMVTVVVQQARKQNPHCRIGIVSAGPLGSAGTRRLGLDVENIWCGSSFSAYVNTLKHYDAVVVIGADVMDGHYYGAGASLRYWIMADLAARAGKRSIVVGFSFEYPEQSLKPMLDAIHPRVHICVRDEVSLDCFRSFCSASAELTSDIAFLLEPAQSGTWYEAAKVWCEAQRAAGRIVCAVNLRPMHYNDPAGSAEKIDLSGVVAQALNDIESDVPIAYMLLPHDFRSGDQSDIDSLSAINAGLLGKEYKPFFLDHETTAIELKAIVGLADILLTGRMHLGIAAISQGVPVISISFQDKFKGYYKLFHLPLRCLISPLEAQEPGAVSRFLRDGLVNRNQMVQLIEASLPEVKSMSERNFSGFGASRAGQDSEVNLAGSYAN